MGRVRRDLKDRGKGGSEGSNKIVGEKVSSSKVLRIGEWIWYIPPAQPKSDACSVHLEEQINKTSLVDADHLLSIILEPYA